MEFTGVTYLGKELEDHEILGLVTTELADFYKQVNGIIAFNGGLHIRGCVNSPIWHSLKSYWTGENALFKKYDQLNEKDIPFGQDCVGNQFILRNSLVHQLNSETGDIENLELTFNEFLSYAIKDPMDFLALQPLQQFHNENGKLEPGELLNVYPPFCMKESGNGISLKNVPVEQRINFLADFYNQIKDLEDGQEIKIKIE